MPEDVPYVQDSVGEATSVAAQAMRILVPPHPNQMHASSALRKCTQARLGIHTFLAWEEHPSQQHMVTMRHRSRLTWPAADHAALMA